MSNEDQVYEQLSLEAERVREDCDYSSRGHYHATIPWKASHRILGVASAVCSALAGAGALKSWGTIFIAGASALATVLAAVLAFLKPGEEADRHQRAADRYLGARNRARILGNVELPARLSPLTEHVDRLKALSAELDEIRTGAPKIPDWAYRLAKRDIEIRQSSAYAADKPRPSSGT